MVSKLRKKLPGGLLLILLLAVSAQAIWGPGLVNLRGGDAESAARSVSTRASLNPGSRLPGKDKSDFPQTLQDARFGTAGADRLGYGVDAHGTHLAYVESQGDPVTPGAGSVALQTLVVDGDGVKSWTGDLDDAQAPAGAISIPAPADSVGFGYQIALNDNYLVVGAKWSQTVYVFDFSGNLVRTIAAPAASARYEEVLNFGESLAMDGDLLVVGARIPPSTGSRMQEWPSHTTCLRRVPPVRLFWLRKGTHPSLKAPWSVSRWPSGWRPWLLVVPDSVRATRPAPC